MSAGTGPTAEGEDAAAPPPGDARRVFRATLANTLAASVTNNFVWFAVTFWVYLGTRSVLATSVMAGIYLGTVALTGVFLGTLVDRYPKRVAMLASSFASLGLYALAATVLWATPSTAFQEVGSPALWAFVGLTLFGAIAGNLRSIALATLVTVLIPAPKRDRANGLVGAATGISYMLSSVFSGLAIGYLGPFWMLAGALGTTACVIAHLLTIPIPAAPRPVTAPPVRVNLPETLRVVGLVPGLFGLIFFSTLNNLLGGSFMALMDAYGLQLVSVQAWGALWGVLSVGFIIGGAVVARRGLGPRPLRTFLRANLVLWGLSILSVARPSIELLAVGMFVNICLVPAVEAAEQTVIQKLIPPDHQGRVFGFAQSVEQAAAPLSALLMGPLAQFVFIPLMTTGAGASAIGPWFGTGPDRGLALLFVVSGAAGLAVTLAALRSSSYRKLSEAYGDGRPEGAPALGVA